MLNRKKVKKIFAEIHLAYKKALRNRNSICTTRSQLFLLVLQNMGDESRLIRYETDCDELKLISGETFQSHVVVAYNELIYDSNLHKPVKKEKYEKKLEKKNKCKIINIDPYIIHFNKTELSSICKDCKLSQSFYDAIDALP